MIGTCKTCAFWDNDECRAVDVYEDEPNAVDRIAFLIQLTVADDHGLTVRLRTGPDFGCVKHEAR